VGPGGSQDAPFKLQGSIPAGTWHVQCDSIIIKPVDVTFSLIQRRGGDDTVLATWMQHWEPLAGGVFDAQPYEHDVDAPALSYKSGDELVFRYEGANTTSDQAYIPNGDGKLANGRIPTITLPR
jgi:hypothetical protein